MKLNKFLTAIAAIFMVLIVGCDESGEKPVLNDELAIEFADLSGTTFVLLKADADDIFQEFEWSGPDYGFDASVTYTVELDVAGNNFADAVIVTTTSESSVEVTVSTVNTKLLSLGLEPGVQVDVEVRVKATVLSSMDPIYSDLKGFNVTPYNDEPDPIFPFPDELFIVGSATPGGWSNPVSVPTQQFTRINSYSYGMVINLTGGQEYLLLPVNGSWDNKYNPPTGGGSGATGSFQPNAGGNNIPGPAVDGTYKIIIDFSTGTYTTTLLTSNPIPAGLFIVGDATPGGWSNPVPVPSQQFTQISNGEFELSLPLTTAKSYLFLPVNGSWDNKYGGTEKLKGKLLKNGDVPGSNTPAPDASGTYNIKVNFLSNKYSLELE